MTDSARQLLSDFQLQGWDCQPFERMLRLADAGPEELVALVSSAIVSLPRSPTFVDAALSLIDVPGLARCAELAVRWMEADPRRVTGDTPAEAVVACTSLQAAGLLTEHLGALWGLSVNRSAYYAEWPWRAADAREVQRLLQVLREGGADERVRAWNALLQTRRTQPLRAAIAAASETAPFLPAEPEACLASVGWTVEDGGLRRLVPDTCLHLQFPEEALEAQLSRPAHLHPTNHPTWFDLGQPAQVATYGGLATHRCGRCAGPLHRLLEMDVVPPGLGVTSRAALQVVTCLTCTGWSDVLYFAHDDDGTARPVERLAEPVEAEFPSAPLVPARVELVVTPDRWRWQDWAMSNGRENLNRLGGEPTWIQAASHPPCPACGRHMSALLQLDSFLTTEDGGELYWGSGGIGYVLWCDGCAVTGVTAQWT